MGAPSTPRRQSAAAAEVDAALAARIAALDVRALRARYEANGAFLHLPAFLPPALLEAVQAECWALSARAHRSWIPGHKRGGAVEWRHLCAAAGTVAALYRSHSLHAFVDTIVGEPTLRCPERDPHRCALYVYTRAGDHIGFHYDRSYYRGRRFTLLLGVIDDSSQRLVCDLRAPGDARRQAPVTIRTTPGTLVLFDGDRLRHAITPLGTGQRRLVVTMEYVTDARIWPWLRLFSDLKDAFGYFGPRAVFLPVRSRS